MSGPGDALDPKGLIAEAYRIEGIGPEECRSIFLDWALSIREGSDARVMIGALLERHGREGHPMTDVLREGLGEAKPERRGGAGGRRRG